MKIIRNNIIPFSGYKAMNLFGVLFVRGNARIDDITLNHEKIHSRQFVELMVLFAVATVFMRWWLPVFAPFAFYVWYVIEYLIHLARFKNHYLAYRRISFEREAYTHQADMGYTNGRYWFNFLKYIG
jgi:hypothetical protein